MELKAMTIQQHNSDIIITGAPVNRYANDTCVEARSIYDALTYETGCTYLIYMYEDLDRNKKYIYSSNWEWQDLLIGKKMINDCPIFKAAFRYLDKVSSGNIILPWNNAPAKLKEEKKVCGLRSEFNIAN